MRVTRWAGPRGGGWINSGDIEDQVRLLGKKSQNASEIGVEQGGKKSGFRCWRETGGFRSTCTYRFCWRKRELRVENCVVEEDVWDRSNEGRTEHKKEISKGGWMYSGVRGDFCGYAMLPWLKSPDKAAWLLVGQPLH